MHPQYLNQKIKAARGARTRLFGCFALALATLALASCKTGYNKKFHIDENTVDAPECEQSPTNANLLSEGDALFELIANLSCNGPGKDGALMGQDLGYFTQFANTANDRYQRTVDNNLFLTRIPSVIGIDYEYSKVFSADELVQANEVVREHWNAGGIVMITWRPLNPWQQIGACNPQGSELADAADLNWCSQVNLRALLANGAMRARWLNRLDGLAEALQYLEDDAIPVLLQPFPHANSADSYWWDLRGSYNADAPEDASLFIDLWVDMYTYLTQQHGLNNLLWVYGPGADGELPEDASDAKTAPVAWAYPGDDYVDIVAGTAENDVLNIPDYEALSALGKPLGMARYNPLPGADGKYSQAGDFDNTLYAARLEGNYQNVAFWLTSANILNESDQITSYMALVDNDNAAELAEDVYILDLKTVNDNSMR